MEVGRYDGLEPQRLSLARPSVEYLSDGLIDNAVTGQASRETTGSSSRRPTRQNVCRSSAGRDERP